MIYMKDLLQLLLWRHPSKKARALFKVVAPSLQRDVKEITASIPWQLLSCPYSLPSPLLYLPNFAHMTSRCPHYYMGQHPPEWQSCWLVIYRTLTSMASVWNRSKPRMWFFLPFWESQLRLHAPLCFTASQCQERRTTLSARVERDDARKLVRQVQFSPEQRRNKANKMLVCSRKGGFSWCF